MPGEAMSRLTDPDLIDKRLEGMQEIEFLWAYFHAWLGYSQETYWMAVNIFDRCFADQHFAKSNGSDNTMTYGGCYLLARAALFIASKYTEVRSEEHTSELQSLISISYAVFCLKKIFF